MINNVNGANPGFFSSPTASPTASMTSSPFPDTSASQLIMDEPDPSEKELAALLNGEGGLSVVDRVPSFKVSYN